MTKKELTFIVASHLNNTLRMQHAKECISSILESFKVSRLHQQKVKVVYRYSGLQFEPSYQPEGVVFVYDAVQRSQFQHFKLIVTEEKLGNYICLMDDDDYINLNYVTAMYNNLYQLQEPNVIHLSSYELALEDNSEHGKAELAKSDSKDFYKDFFLKAHKSRELHGTVFRTGIFRQLICRLKPKWLKTGDADLFVNLIIACQLNYHLKKVYVPQALYYYRFIFDPKPWAVTMRKGKCPTHGWLCACDLCPIDGGVGSGTHLFGKLYTNKQFKKYILRQYEDSFKKHQAAENDQEIGEEIDKQLNPAMPNWL